MAGGRRLGDDVPAESAGRVSDGLAGRELLNRRARQQAMVSIDSAVQNHLRKYRRVARG